MHIFRNCLKLKNPGYKSLDSRVSASSQDDLDGKVQCRMPHFPVLDLKSMADFYTPGAPALGHPF
jgi:hypothetical protein